MNKLGVYKKGREPAFPYTHVDLITEESGLTKREYFAAMVLQGLVVQSFNLPPMAGSYADHFSRMAVNYADALINAVKE